MLVTKAKHNRIVRDLEREIDKLNTRIKNLESENNDAKFKLMATKNDLEGKLKNKDIKIKKMSAVNQNNEMLVSALK